MRYFFDEFVLVCVSAIDVKVNFYQKKKCQMEIRFLLQCMGERVRQNVTSSFNGMSRTFAIFIYFLFFHLLEKKKFKSSFVYSNNTLCSGFRIFVIFFFSIYIHISHFYVQLYQVMFLNFFPFILCGGFYHK